MMGSIVSFPLQYGNDFFSGRGQFFSDINFFFQKFSKPSNSSKNLKFEILPYKMNQNTCKIFKNKIFKRELKFARFVKKLEI